MRTIEIASRKQMAEDIALKVLMLDLINNAIILHDFDGNIIYANKAFRDFFKIENEDIHLKKIYDFMNVSKERFRQRTIEIIKNVTLRFDGNYSLEGGGTFILEVRAQTLDLDGKKVILSVCDCISNRLEYENALENMVKRYRSLLETSSDWIWETNKNCKFIYSNKRSEDFLGYTTAQLMGMRICELAYPEGSQKVKDQFRKMREYAQECGRPVSIRLTLKHRDGKPKVLDTLVTAHRSLMNGQDYTYRGVSRDMLIERVRFIIPEIMFNG